MSGETIRGRDTKSHEARTPEALRRLLVSHRAGEVDTEAVLDALRDLPFRDIGYARVDTHRHLRTGLAEVVFGIGKTTDQIVGLVDELARGESTVIVTRTTKAAHDAVRERHAEAQFDPECGLLWLERSTDAEKRRGTIVVVAAGTADAPVASEAARTAELLGNRVERVSDVGVAGLHRLLPELSRLRVATVVIVVAGMEGALASVIGGLIAVPVIAVPTSVGYGASFGGLAALLAMLNSCAAGVTVVNIDNGFGAAVAANLINRA